MEYKLSVGKKTITADMKPPQDGMFQVRLDDRDYAVSFERIQGRHLSLTVNGVHHNAYVDGAHDEKMITVKGLSASVRDEDARAQVSHRGKSKDEIPSDITPPMPAVVVRILVAVGDPVVKGQEVIVVSAMKMETVLRAPYDGAVAAVNVAAEDKVMPGDILVNITKEEEGHE